jgi:hypothetical protein
MQTPNTQPMRKPTPQSDFRPIVNCTILCKGRVADYPGRTQEEGFSIYHLEMAASLTFDDFAGFIREYWAVPARKEIAPETQFERDLGLTGDDGNDLLLATEKQFGVALCSDEVGVHKTFNLEPNEYLFHSEGLELFPFEMTSLFSATAHSVRKLTVGELYEAVRKAKAGRSKTSEAATPE